MATKAQVWSDLPIPPGELVAETLEALDLSQAELARRMGRPPQAINEIVHGTKEITAETAIQLERVLGVPAHIWLGLEAEYQHTKARHEDRNRLTSEVALAAKFPYRVMAKLGWVPKTRDKTEQVAHLLQFFGVASLRNVRSAEEAAYRVSRIRAVQPEALAAWLRKGELEAKNIETKPFSENRLREFLRGLHPLTTKPPGVFEPLVKKRLAECGVAFILLPHLPKTYAHGATRWLAPDKALVQLSLRGKWADIFWFTLFHELSHVLLHGRKDIFIEWWDGDEDEREREADAFASEQLISPAAYNEFIARTPQLSSGAIAAFAKSLGIAPGIVVGRLQHDGHLSHAELNHLRTRFEWAGESAT